MENFSPVLWYYRNQFVYLAQRCLNFSQGQNCLRSATTEFIETRLLPKAEKDFQKKRVLPFFLAKFYLVVTKSAVMQ